MPKIIVVITMVGILTMIRDSMEEEEIEAEDKKIMEIMFTVVRTMILIKKIDNKIIMVEEIISLRIAKKMIRKNKYSIILTKSK